MDIDYTGGVSVEAATNATISVPAWDAYMKPLTVPIVVSIKMNRFSARVLLKIKPFWESNRLWFGFYHKPEMKLELQVIPVAFEAKLTWPGGANHLQQAHQASAG